MSEQMATFVVEYACDRRCQVELDLSDIHARFTHGQMLRTAEDAHLEAHEAAVRVFSPRPEVVVRAGLVTASGGANAQP